MTNKHLGSSFDEFLLEENLLESTKQVAIKRVTAWQTIFGVVIKKSTEMRGIMSKLYPVYLTKFIYPCAAYCLERIGSMLPVDDLLKFQGQPCDEKTKFIQGDVLVWVNLSSSTEMSPIGINACGVITGPVNPTRHFAVYEGNGYVSSTFHSEDVYYPGVRVTALADRPHRPVPDYYIPYRTLVPKPVLSSAPYPTTEEKE